MAMAFGQTCLLKWTSQACLWERLRRASAQLFCSNHLRHIFKRQFFSSLSTS